MCNVSLLVAIGVNDDGYREILGICEGAEADAGEALSADEPESAPTSEPAVVEGPQRG